MNFAHLHLAICHVPVVGMIFACVGLVIAVIRNHPTLNRWILALTVVVGLSALPVTWSGEKAEDSVSDLPGISMDLVEEHEEAAEMALTLTLVTAGLAAVGIAAGFVRPGLGRLIALGVLLAGLAASVSMAYTANLGGQIGHTEIRAGTEEN